MALSPEAFVVERAWTTAVATTLALMEDAFEASRWGADPIAGATTAGLALELDASTEGGLVPELMDTGLALGAPTGARLVPTVEATWEATLAAKDALASAGAGLVAAATMQLDNVGPTALETASATLACLVLATASLAVAV